MLSGKKIILRNHIKKQRLEKQVIYLPNNQDVALVNLLMKFTILQNQ